MITIKTGKSTLTIDQNGGTIENLTLNNRKILGRYVRADGKSAATHLCSPNFGPICGNYSLPQHGTVRNLPWKYVATDTSIQLSTVIPSSQKHSYPDGITICQNHSISNNFYSCETIHRNTSNIPLPINSAIHCYFDSPHGWENSKINNEKMYDLIKRTQYIATPKTITVTLPKIQPFTIKTQGYSYLMLWTGRKDEIFDTKYVCIEPVEFNPDTGFTDKNALLLPMESRVSTYSIQIN